MHLWRNIRFSIIRKRVKKSSRYCPEQAGQIISLFGNAVVRFALPVHLLEVTGSSVVLGVVSGLSFLPMALMAPFGGIIADRINKRNIMVFLDFFTCGLIVVFLILYGRLNLVAMVLILLFLLYGISGAYQPSVQASIPVLVEEERVMQANAVVNMVSSLSGLLGPAVGKLTFCAAGVNFFMSALMIIGLPVIVMQELDFSPAEASRMYGYMQAVLGAGGLAGGIGAGLLGQKLSMDRSYRFLMFAGGMQIPMGLALLLPCPPYAVYGVLALSALLIMALASIYSIQIMAHIQVTVPSHLTGKVIAWVLALSNCAQPAGQIIYGTLFENMRGMMAWIFFGTAAVSVLIGWYSRDAVAHT